jgi:N4-gp56 family major capsid protein
MANTYTGTASITGQTGVTNLVTSAYDKYIQFALRSEPMYRSFADVRPVDVTAPGSSVVFQRYADLSAATTALTENVDPDSVALSNTTTVTVTLNEYGNAVLVTEKLALESLSDVDPAIAELVAWNMRDSLDQLTRTALLTTPSNIVRESSGISTSAARNTIAATDVLKSRDVRYVVSKLRGNSAIPFDGGYFTGIIHPDQSYDLRAETGTAAWRDPHVYAENANSAIWAGEVGVYEGVRFIESPRTYNNTDGASSAKVHRSHIFGRQALAEAVAREPGVVIGPITDKLMRARPIGWKGLIGWSIYRQEALFQIETGSSY